ncbi:ATP-binding protein [Pseudoalteromonas sp. H105]|uniref:ATP-binding protein n=1 Tax=Pseudoalteromonas sp. H105 TaxID=1348393 RepID=UPI0007322329|nr:ATP-binding protein [Pseudoalteromonas sp. H105]KTF13106.1 hypothetical protein ATS75_16995 [Pseudoalteromonas sp. H105]
MLRIWFLVVLLVCFLPAKATVLDKKEFEKLRTEIRDNYAQSPHVAIASLDEQLASDNFTPDQRLVLLNYKAWFQLEAKQFKPAMKTLIIYKNLAEKSSKRALMYGYYNISAGVYIQLNLHKLALEHLSEALKYAALLSDDITNQTLNNIGEVYLALGMLDEAERAFRRYADYLQHSNKPLDNSIVTINLAKTLIAKEQFTEAKSLLSEIMKVKQQHQFDYLLAESYLLMAEIERAEKQYPLALISINQSLAIFTVQDLVKDQHRAQFELAKTYAAMDDTDRATNELTRVTKNIHLDDDLLFTSKVYLFESQLFESTGRYQQAISSYKKHTAAETQLIKQQADINLAKAIAQAETNEKEVKIAELTREKQLKAQKVNAFKDLALSVVISLIIISLGSFFAISNIYRRKQHLANTLQTLEETQTNLIEAQKIASLTVLVSGMAHQLNTPIGTATTAITYIAENLQELEQKFKSKTLSTKDFNRFIENTNEAQHLVLNNITRVVSMIEQFKALNVASSLKKPMQSFELKQFITERLETLKTYFTIHLDYQVKGDEVSLTSNPSIIGDVLKTLVINAYEHGFNGVENPTITVTIKKQRYTITLIFQDNGSGIDDSILKEIFTPFYSTNLGGNHLGLGLNIVFNAVKYQLFGNISAVPCQHGACFIMNLPIDGHLSAKEQINASSIKP